MENPLGDQIRSLTEQIKTWYENHPRAQRAYEQLSADVDALVARVESLVEETQTLRELRDRVATAIDPPGRRSESSADTPSSLPGAENKAPDSNAGS